MSKLPQPMEDTSWDDTTLDDEMDEYFERVKSAKSDSNKNIDHIKKDINTSLNAVSIKEAWSCPAESANVVKSEDLLSTPSVQSEHTISTISVKSERALSPLEDMVFAQDSFDTTEIAAVGGLKVPQTEDINQLPKNSPKVDLKKGNGGTFCARFESAECFKNIIKSVKDIVNEAPLEWSHDCIRINSMDAAHVAFVSIVFKKEMFTEFICERPITVGLNLDFVNKALSCAKKTDGLTIKCAEKSLDSVQFGIVDKENMAVKGVTLKVMNLQVDCLDFPETLDYEATFKMDSRVFAEICRNLVQFSDTITITVHEEGVNFNGKGEIGSYCINLYNESLNEKTYATEKDEVKTTFSSQYMLQFSKAFIVADDVKISISTDYPATIEYAIGDDDTEDFGSLRFCLAERVGED